jgi:hypothetical protein
VRAYTAFRGADPGPIEAPPGAERYAGEGRRLDHVACFRHRGDDLDGWRAFLQRLLRDHGPDLATLQVTEEPNHAGMGGDGGSPAVRQALVEGVVAARHDADRLGLDVAIGANQTPMPDSGRAFWRDLTARGGDAFAAALGYVGLDFFPDMFRPIPPDRLTAMVTAVLTGLRAALTDAGIPPTVPIHITENGWGTGPGRSEARQAEVLEAVVRTVATHAEPLHITTYEQFSLRDADSAHPDPLYHLGLVRSDYTPKPAYDTYRRLIAEFG